MNTDTEENVSAAHLQQRLQVKDQVIAALTAQLEETAEKLDRVQRSGSDSGRRGGATGDSLAGGPGLAGQLEEAMQVWNEAQPAERLVRIEEGIDRILSFLAHGAPPESGESPSQSGLEYWEAAKAEILGETGAAGTGPPQSQAADEGAPAGDPAAEPELPEIPPEPEPPQPLAAGVDEEGLWQGIDEREAYIHFLSARLRHEQNRRFPPIHWKELEQVPQELSGRLQELEHQLREQLKQAEIAHSLERAALTRERAKLSQIKQQLERQVYQLRAAPSAAPEEDAEVNAEEERKERRWSRIFTPKEK